MKLKYTDSFDYRLLLVRGSAPQLLCKLDNSAIYVDYLLTLFIKGEITLILERVLMS